MSSFACPSNTELISLFPSYWQPPPPFRPHCLIRCHPHHLSPCPSNPRKDTRPPLPRVSGAEAEAEAVAAARTAVVGLPRANGVALAPTRVLPAGIGTAPVRTATEKILRRWTGVPGIGTRRNMHETASLRTGSRRIDFPAAQWLCRHPRKCPLPISCFKDLLRTPRKPW